jgi:hypothetical protein
LSFLSIQVKQFLFQLPYGICVLLMYINGIYGEIRRVKSYFLARHLNPVYTVF